MLLEKSCQTWAMYCCELFVGSPGSYASLAAWQGQSSALLPLSYSLSHTPPALLALIKWGVFFLVPITHVVYPGQASSTVHKKYMSTEKAEYSSIHFILCLMVEREMERKRKWLKSHARVERNIYYNCVCASGLCSYTDKNATVLKF